MCALPVESPPRDEGVESAEPDEENERDERDERVEPEQPTAFDWSLALGATHLEGPAGRVAIGDALGGAEIVMLYVTASWCPPCRAFTPQLADLYNEAAEATEGGQPRRVEVVLVSRDQDAEKAAEYRAKMPWLALPDLGRQGSEQIVQQCGIRGIPALLVYRVATGEQLCANAVSRATDFFIQ